MNYTLNLAGRYSQFRFEQLTSNAIENAKKCLIDYLACTFAGYAFESSRIAREFALRNYARGRCVIIGSPRKLKPVGACFVNSTTGHGPELDDLSKEGGLHVGVVIIPVALAVGEDLGLTGRDLVMAIVLGYDVDIKVGKAANPKIQLSKGFHPTATCGVFGAAATAARMMGLGAEQTANALGIAGSFASGSLECYSDGSFTKRLNPGIAASSGVIAAELAAKGYSGPKSILEGPRGFLRAFSGEDSKLEELSRTNGLEIEKIYIKTHACCGFNQAPIDAMLRIRLEKRIDCEHIKSVVIELSKLAYDTVGQPSEIKLHPKNDADAQFSAHYSVAIACIEGKALLGEYSQASIQRADVHELMSKIEVRHSAELDAFVPETLPARVTVTMNDGSKHIEEVRYPKGDPMNPLSWEDILAKFEALVSSPLLNRDRRSRLLDAIHNLEEMKNVRILTRLLARSNKDE